MFVWTGSLDFRFDQIQKPYQSMGSLSTHTQVKYLTRPFEYLSVLRLMDRVAAAEHCRDLSANY